MAEEYRKIRKAILDDIAAAIRFQKKSTRQFNPDDFAGIIKAMLTIPCSEANSRLSAFTFADSAAGDLPVIYKGTAESRMNSLRFRSGVSGCLTE